ncbi:hypothetical protein GGI1_16709 [Acidithiobacillus sp. GGI-221]|nr:hypothetical protein GGI1_16709 [Acidithiobacillus sp. GGI-221]
MDLGNLPPLTKKQTRELKMLRQLSDDGIDYSDIHALSDDFWVDAVRFEPRLSGAQT